MCACWHPRILTSLYPEVHACLPASFHPHILIYSDSCVFGCIPPSSHPYVIFPGLSVFTCILASSYPHTFRFIRACCYPCILTFSYTQIPVYLVVSSRPHILMSYSKVCMCLLVSSHPHILIPSGSYVLVGILASSYPQIHACFLLSLDPLILIFLYITLTYISQANIYINTLKQKIMQFTIQQNNKTYMILDPTLKQVIVRLHSSAGYIYAYNL